MNDKDWLDKVQLAYKVYSEEVRPSYDVELFVEWMYKQYGIQLNVEKQSLANLG